MEVDVPGHDPELVATAFFTSDSVWAVRVERTVGYTSEEDPTPVRDAVVEILTGGSVLETLAHSDSGLYAGAGSPPANGRQYEVRVRAPGFDAVEGSDRLPDPPVVSHFRETVSGQRAIDVRLDLTIDDPAGEKNFYGLFLVQVRVEYEPSSQSLRPLPPSLATFESADEVLDDGLLAFLDRDVKQYRRAFFGDDTFDGGQKTLDLRIAYQAPDPAAALQIWRGFALVVVTASEALYDYWISADKQIASNANPFAEPVRIASNMSNGFGVFGGFEYRFYPLTATCRSMQPPQAVCDAISSAGTLRVVAP